ncbi:MAG: S24 family peptidase [Eubacteriales bacterium]|nr:S24 family peptidase [Eubacteriales bacterium]MDD3200346.1 S24 family peptidase [Eubacteriales bacterium]MDD4629829.1 S24 family peptidase [Eubacteriales bacterium]
MSYAEMLNSIISESELSLRQISKLCTQFDISITPSYISQLKNGKLPPPSPEVSLAIAKVCNSKNQSQLIFQGYMEKAPDVIKEYMLASSQLNRIMLESLYKSNKDNTMTQEAVDFIRNLDVLSALEMSSRYVNADNNIDPAELVKEITLSGGGIAKVQAQGDMVNFFLGDTSMSPMIPVHSYIYILPTRLDLLKERDIIAFYPNNRKQATLRRIFYSNDKILLIPEDKNYQIYIIKHLEEIDYIGKVVSYKVDL